ncbi:MAG: helix-turn-helix domain-containing protein [Ruminiclostridium sp.]
MNYKALGKKIRDERLKSGMTQANLAEKVEVTTAYIGQIERGERKFSIETLVNIANEFNVSMDYLLSNSMEENPNALISEMNLLLKNRSSEDVRTAIEITKTLFQQINKSS